jgi:hypothetical protein
MTVIKSNHTGPLGLPRGPVVEAGKSVNVDIPGYDRFLRLHSVGSAWLAAGVIEIVGTKELATKPEDEGGGDGDDQPKTAAEVLAMANEVHFQTFKTEAAKLLGDDMPAKKADIVAALEELATKPEA